MPKKKVSKEKSIRRTKTLTEVFVCAIIIAGGAYVGKNAVDNVKIVQKSQYVDTSGASDIDIPDTNIQQDPNQISFNEIEVDSKNKFIGELILVNNYHEYFAPEDENLVSIMEKNDETERDSYIAVDYTYMIRESVYEPMSKMIDDFYDIYHNDTLIIYGSYRTHEFQQELYDNRKEDDEDESEYPLVAMPGYSEHETGYAFDFSETEEYDYQGTGDFAWLNSNCYKYGFIIRYPEDKESITEYRSEPWHFRYVGIPHATYMTKNNLCLEEYTELLRNNYSFEKEHLQIVDENGGEYEVYFVAADDGAEKTKVPVPMGYRYDISGNNVDGFIITVYKNDNTVVPTTTTPAPVDETPEEQPTADEVTLFN